ncbi:MAG: hypothetical protein PHY59_05825 [Methanobacterium sp.]|nr:hypothetical protein [Methanobacterium sp.]
MAAKKNDTITIDKKFKARMKIFKEALKSEEKKIELHDSIYGSEVLIRFEVFLPSRDPLKFVDGLFLYMNDTGEIVEAEYYIKADEKSTILKIKPTDLKIVKEIFNDSFSLEIE